MPEPTKKETPGEYLIRIQMEYDNKTSQIEQKYANDPLKSKSDLSLLQQKQETELRTSFIFDMMARLDVMKRNQTCTEKALDIMQTMYTDAQIPYLCKTKADEKMYTESVNTLNRTNPIWENRIARAITSVAESTNVGHLLTTYHKALTYYTSVIIQYFLFLREKITQQ